REDVVPLEGEALREATVRFEDQRMIRGMSALIPVLRAGVDGKVLREWAQGLGHRAGETRVWLLNACGRRGGGRNIGSQDVQRLRGPELRDHLVEDRRGHLVVIQNAGL